MYFLFLPILHDIYLNCNNYTWVLFYLIFHPPCNSPRLNNSFFTRPDWQPSHYYCYCTEYPGRYFIALLPKFAPQESIQSNKAWFSADFPSPLPQKPAARGKALFNLSLWPAYIYTISYIYIRCILSSYMHTYTLTHSFIISPGTRFPTSLDRDLDSTHTRPDLDNFLRRKHKLLCVCFSWADISSRQWIISLQIIRYQSASKEQSTRLVGTSEAIDSLRLLAAF